MSSSALEVVRTTMGIRRNSGSALISLSASRPSLRGMFRSSKIRPGNGASFLIGVTALTAQIFHQFFAVFHAMELIDQTVFRKRVVGQLAIVRIIICQ